MYGHVYIIVYIREPTTEEYKIFNIWWTSFSDFGDNTYESLKCATIGVLIGFTFSMLNQHST